MGYSQEKIEYWRGILAQYASGNDAPVEFCRRNHLSTKSFYKWRIRLSAELPENKRSDISALLLVPAASLPTAPIDRGRDSGVSVESGGLRICLSCGFDDATLRRVLEVAGVRPC